MALAYIPNYSATPLALLLEQYKNQPAFTALVQVIAGELQAVEDALWNTLTIAVGPSMDPILVQTSIGAAGSVLQEQILGANSPVLAGDQSYLCFSTAPGLLSGTVLFKGVPFRIDSMDPNNHLGFFVTALENTPSSYVNPGATLVTFTSGGSLPSGTTVIPIDNSSSTNPAAGWFTGGTACGSSYFSTVTVLFVGTTGKVVPQGSQVGASGSAFLYASLADATLAAAPAWTGPVTYNNGTPIRALQSIVTNGGNIYLCITSGLSASSGGPTGTGSNITDGAAHWRYVGAGTGYVLNGLAALQLGAGVIAAYALSVPVTAIVGVTAVTNPVAVSNDSAGFRGTVVAYSPTSITITPPTTGLNSGAYIELRPGGDTGGAGTLGEANSPGWTINFAPSRSGAQLDLLGRLLGMPRNGLDDYTYIAWLNATVHINNSKGTINDFIAVLTPLLPEGWKFHIHTDLFTGTVVINLLQQPSAQLLSQLQNVAQLTRAAGIRLIFQVSLTERFTFAGGEGLGFNQGRLGSTGAGIVSTGQEVTV